MSKTEELLKMMTEMNHDLLVVMQASFIEWQHGKGAEEAMHWIANTLDGPGLIPDENAPYGKEAQAFFDANQANPMPPCSVCGRPSNQLGWGVAACSVEHFRQAKGETPNAKVRGPTAASSPQAPLERRVGGAEP